MMYLLSLVSAKDVRSRGRRNTREVMSLIFMIVMSHLKKK